MELFCKVGIHLQAHFFSRRVKLNAAKNDTSDDPDMDKLLDITTLKLQRSVALVTWWLLVDQESKSVRAQVVVVARKWAYPSTNPTLVQVVFPSFLSFVQRGHQMVQ